MTHSSHISIIGGSDISREGLCRILRGCDFEITLAAQDYRELLQMENSDAADHVVILDTSSTGQAIETCRSIRQTHTRLKIVLLVDECCIDSLRSAFAAGADGVLMKQISCAPLISALDLISFGEKVIPSQLVDLIGDQNWSSNGENWERYRSETNLSEREISILRCLMNGSANKIISRRLKIAEATVKVHIKAILRKLHVINRTQAAIWAVEHGLGENEPNSPRSEAPAIELGKPAINGNSAHQ